ncbi:MAG: geranylgeranyl reductase family protein [Desulfovibrionales bacterium]
MDTPIDVLIIGGGPAGATACHLLARTGRSVLLVDRESFPRPKLCAGLLTRKTIQILEGVFGTGRDDLIHEGIIHHSSTEYAIRGQRSLLANGTLDYPFHFVQRTTYDHMLLNRAAAHGGELRLNDPVVRLDPLSGTAQMKSGHRVRARFIIGADGANSLVRRTLMRRKLVRGRWQQGLATAVETFATAPGVRTTYPVLYFGCIPWGYGWSFPGKDHQVLGLCGLNSRSRGDFTKLFKEFLSRLSLDPNTCRIKGHPLPYGNPLVPPGHGRVLLAGDACGLVDPLLGEGIYYAHASGLLAAKAIIRAADNPESAMTYYSRALSTTLLSEMRYIAMWRWFTFTCLKPFDFRFLGTLVRSFQKQMEETIQGQRLFRWMKRVADRNDPVQGYV